MKINYLKGDATVPQGSPDEHKIIVHNCNNVGAWGAGFVMAISKKWASPEAYYRRWAYVGKCPLSKVPFQLGQIQVVQVEKDISVCNLVGQSGCGHLNMLPPVRYQSIHEGLIRLRLRLESAGDKVSIHMPYLGAGLSGGHWPTIWKIIDGVFGNIDYPVNVYEWE